MNSTSSPSPLPGSRGWKASKFQPSNHLLDSTGNQLLTHPFLGTSQSRLINLKIDSFVALGTGSSKSFRSSVIGKGTKTKCIFPNIKYSITVIFCNLQIKHFKETSPLHPQNTAYVFSFYCSLLMGLIQEECSRWLGTTDIWSDNLSLHRRMSSSISGLYPLDASSILHAPVVLLVTTKNVPWGAKSPSGKNHCWV